MYFKPFNVAQRQYMCISVCVCACLPVHVRVCRECVIYTHGSTLVLVPIRTSVYFLYLLFLFLNFYLYLSLYCIFKTNQREVMFDISILFFSCYCTFRSVMMMLCFKCFELRSVDCFLPFISPPLQVCPSKVFSIGLHSFDMRWICLRGYTGSFVAFCRKS